jgi:hypothetical protein
MDLQLNSAASAYIGTLTQQIAATKSRANVLMIVGGGASAAVLALWHGGNFAPGLLCGLAFAVAAVGFAQRQAAASVGVIRDALTGLLNQLKG